AQDINKYTEEIKTFEQFVKKQMEIDRIPGISIGFMKDDFIWAKGFGYADLENKVPATEKSSYRLASNTKSMTAAAILQLVEKSKIDLDAEVQKYVPYFPKKRWPVTVRQLLGHLGGITHYKQPWELHIKEHKDTRDAIAIFENYELVAEPGTKYNYSSYGYNLLGAVIEGASKQSYGDYMRENIWKPLGMNDTYMDDPGKIIPNRVKGYRLIDGKLKNSEFIDISSRFAAGGTRSTVVDLLKYIKGYRDKKILSSKSIDLMYTSMVTKDGRFTNYGMGWRLSPIDGRFVVSHSGSQAETRTYLIRFPSQNFAIAIAYNFEGASRDNYAKRLYQLLFGESWNLAPYITDKVNDAIYTGMLNTFNYGFSYFDRYKKPLSKDRKELADAFAYFNKYVNKDMLQSSYRKTMQKIRDGRHPVSGQKFVKLGSYIAIILNENYGAQRIDTYHKMGPIFFFRDYIEFYKNNPNSPDELKFSEEFEKIVEQWYKDWKKTCNEYILAVHIAPYSDINTIGKKLKKTFEGSKIYPNFSRTIASTVRYFYLNDNYEKAAKTANLNIELYPELAIPYVSLANTYICAGKYDEALRMYKKAKNIKPDDPSITPNSIYRYAYELGSYGKLDEAKKILEIGLKLYPEEARFYDGIAEIYLKMAEKFYKKALKANPMYEHAREMLKKIK
ncbi:hypothetical protein DRQ09_09840, partial [candidate division KSB1 bacterium]